MNWRRCIIWQYWRRRPPSWVSLGMTAGVIDRANLTEWPRAFAVWPKVYPAISADPNQSLIYSITNPATAQSSVSTPPLVVIVVVVVAAEVSAVATATVAKRSCYQSVCRGRTNGLHQEVALYVKRRAPKCQKALPSFLTSWIMSSSFCGMDVIEPTCCPSVYINGGKSF